MKDSKIKPFWELGLNSHTMLKEESFNIVEYRIRQKEYQKEYRKLRYENKKNNLRTNKSNL